MFLITFTICLIFFFIHISDFISIVDKVFGVFTPIIYGLIIAYVLNYPYRFFRDKAFRKIGTKRAWLQRVRTPLALVLTYIIFFGVVVFLISILYQDMKRSIQDLINKFPEYAKNLQNISDDVVGFVRDRTGYDMSEGTTYNDVIGYFTGGSAEQFLKNLVSSLPGTIFDIGYTIYNWILGIIFSIYLLANKETLLRQSRKLIIAWTPKRFSDYFFKVADVVNNKCGKFIIGRIIDSTIIGIMCFIGMSIFHFHYPLLISVLIAVSNLIPFFGPFIGAIPSVILLLIIDPMEALWFIVFDLVLQQFDGNILGPKILGESVGVSGFWIMVSVIVGGGLFGIPGMLLGVPIFAAIFTLVSEGVSNRLKKKEALAQAAAAAQEPLTQAADGEDAQVPAEPAADPPEPPQNTL